MPSLQDQVNKGVRAKLMLDDELVQSTLAQLEADYLKAWKETRRSDSELREKIWIAVEVLGKFKDHLISIANDGKLAQAEIQRLNKRAA